VDFTRELFADAGDEGEPVPAETGDLRRFSDAGQERLRFCRAYARNPGEGEQEGSGVKPPGLLQKSLFMRMLAKPLR
jgi:hypothetical protein